MEKKRYLPLIDKLFFIVSIPTLILVGAGVAISVYSIPALLIMCAVFMFVLYVLISPLFGYVELGESSLVIKYGFFLKKEIPYTSIRDITRERKFYSDSMLSLKNSLDHVNIKYNKFDVTSVSVKSNDEFIAELEKRI
ncbi:MAG: PH domain-containing protein [Clostridia bacterium]|nr:PH domain-containing protein [Clostridia bacterium]